MDEVEFGYFDVVCENDACGNAGQVVRVVAMVENPYVVCGPCGAVLSVTFVGTLNPEEGTG